MLSTLVLLAQLQIPAPVGYVNDFAHVIDDPSRQQMLAVIEEVRRKSGGEIVVVTLPDLGGRPAIDVARDIGRQWNVGAKGGPGERAKNAGVVLLLKPGERPGDGRAELAIATGSGAEGFITDALAGRIRDAIGEAVVQRGSYAGGLVTGVWLLAQAYAKEFGFELTGSPPEPARGGGIGIPPQALIIAGFVFFLVVLPMLFRVAFALTAFQRPYYRSGGGWLTWLLLSSILRSGGRRGGWGGGWSGGGGGGWGGGVVSTSDLKYVSRAMQVTAAGQYGLADNQMNVDLVVRTGRAELAAKVTGDAASPSIRVNPSAILQGRGLERGTRDVGEGVREFLKRLR